MVGCCVPRCGRNSSKPSLDDRFSPQRNVTFHQPPSERTLREKWVRMLRYGGRPEEWEPNNNTKICSLHYKLEDLRFNDKGTQIIKGALPDLPWVENKKPLRRNKASANTKAAFEQLVQSTVLEEQLDAVDADLFGLNLLGELEMTGSTSINFEEAPEIREPIAPKRKKVVRMPVQTSEEEGAAAVIKKVVRLPEEQHTFETPADQTYEDPCLSMYGDMMDLIKKFTQQMYIHHPGSKATAAEELLKQAGSIFSPEETQKRPVQCETFLVDDPYMGTSSGDSQMARELFMQDIDSIISEAAYSEVLDNPEKFL